MFPEGLIDTFHIRPVLLRFSIEYVKSLITFNKVLFALLTFTNTEEKQLFIALHLTFHLQYMFFVFCSNQNLIYIESAFI